MKNFNIHSIFVRFVILISFMIMTVSACGGGSSETVRVETVVVVATPTSSGEISTNEESESQPPQPSILPTAIPSTPTPTILVEKAGQDIVITENTYLVDSRDNQYEAVGNIIGDVIGNFEIYGTIKMTDAYRPDGASWAGLLIRADNPIALHEKDRGYLFFIRENGKVGIHDSNLDHVREERNTDLSGWNENRFKIVADNSRLEFYINDDLIISTDKGYRGSGYLILNVGGAKAEFTLDRIVKY